MIDSALPRRRCLGAGDVVDVIALHAVGKRLEELLRSSTVVECQLEVLRHVHGSWTIGESKNDVNLVAPAEPRLLSYGCAHTDQALIVVANVALGGSGCPAMLSKVAVPPCQASALVAPIVLSSTPSSTGVDVDAFSASDLANPRQFILCHIPVGRGHFGARSP